MIYRHRRGSLMIDVLLAIGVAAIFSVAIAGLVSASSRGLSAARQESQAVDLAKETMEQLVAVKHAGWAGLVTGPVAISQQDSSFVLTPAATDQIVDQVFRRHTVIEVIDRDTNNDPISLRATVTMFWTAAGQPHQVSFVQHLTNWKSS